MKLPLIRSLAVAPARAPILRYGVALLSTVLALIPTLFFSDVAESRLVDVRRRGDGQRLVRRMEAGTRRHLFCAHRQRLLFVHRESDAQRVSQGDRAPRLVLRRGPADLLVQRRPPRYPGEPAPVREQLSLAGDERAVRHLPLRCPRNPAGRKPRAGGYVWLCQRRRTHGQASGKPVRRCPAMVSNRRLFSRPQGIQQPDHRVRAQGWRGHRGAHFRTLHSERQRAVALSKFLWKTLPKPARWSCNSVRRKRWKRSAASPAASRTTSTIC